MKKILSLIFIGAVIAFTGCTEEPNTAEPSSVNETALTKATEENMTENTTEAEVSDEEYLMNLSKQLKLGMSVQEIIDAIGEPDVYSGSGILWLEYYRGDYSLDIRVWSPYGNADLIWIYNEKNDQKTIICDKNTQLSSPANETKTTEESTENTTEAEVSDEEYLINLGKQLKLGMTEEEVIEKIGEPDAHTGSGLYWLEYHRGDCVLRIYINYFENELYSVRVGNGTTNKTTYIELEDDNTQSGDKV
ncbi:MAG: hypothetical protein HDT13_02200 [Butyrivibrio sp.]|nr:hypothetical protein [Butyrivibrio sp.]